MPLSLVLLLLETLSPSPQLYSYCKPCPPLLSSTLFGNPMPLSLVLLLLETLSPSPQLYSYCKPCTPLLSSILIVNPIPLFLVLFLLETLCPFPQFYSYWKPYATLLSSTLIEKRLPECINYSSYRSILKQGETLKISSFQKTGLLVTSFSSSSSCTILTITKFNFKKTENKTFES